MLGLGTLLAAPELIPAILEVQATRSGPPPEGRLVGQALPWAGLTGFIHPRAFVIDQRWYHLGAAALLIPFGVPANRRAWALAISGAGLVAVGMGLDGPLGPLLRPVIWALYPVETGAAALGVLFLAVGVGLGVDRVLDPNPAVRGLGVPALGLAGLVIVGIGASADLGLYHVSLAGPAEHARASAMHGAVAVVLLVGILALRSRVSVRTAGVLMLVLVLADGLVYAWRVEAAIPSPVWKPSAFATRSPALAGMDLDGPGRVLQLPLRPVRELQGRRVDDLWTHPGHGWGHNPMADPALETVREAAALRSGPLWRNAGGADGVSRTGGRAKVPPMPWSVLTHGLASRRGRDPELAESPELLARTLELLGVRWVVSKTADWALPRHRRLDAVPAAALRAELSDFRPPALLSPAAVVVPDPHEALQRLLHGDDDLRDTAVLSEAPPFRLGGSGRAIRGDVERWEPGAWRVSLPAHAGGILTVADRFHPGWTARSEDGGELGVVRANLVQLGVVLPAGVRTVELRFVAPGTSAGGMLGGLGLVILVLGLTFGGRLHGRANHKLRN
jgi:hypothetical protein